MLVQTFHKHLMLSTS